MRLPLSLIAAAACAALLTSACAKASEDQCRRAALHIQEIEWRVKATERIAELPEDQREPMRKLLADEWNKRKGDIVAASAASFVADCTGKTSLERIECIMSATDREAYQACLIK